MISDLDLSQNSVAENSAAGTIVHYQAFAFDADATVHGVVYSLDDNAGGRFAINANTGVVTVADGSGLNYEVNSSHSIIVRALSDDGSTSVTTVGIAVLDVAERPIGFADYYLTTNIDVLRLLGTGVLLNDIDPDGDVLSIQILSGPSHGVLAIASNGSFQYTAQSDFIGRVTFVYEAFDGALMSDPITVTIDVLLPANLTTVNSGLGGSGSGTSNSNSSNSGQVGSQIDNTPIPIGNFTTALIPVVESFVPKGISVAAPAGLEASGTARGHDVHGIGLSESRGSLRVGEMSPTLTRRVTRQQSEQWISQIEYTESEGLTRREEFAWQIMNDDKQNREEKLDQSPISLNMGTVVTMVLGTGVVLWVVQATQLAATFITATAPTWMQLDLARTLDELAKEKTAKDEAIAKIFG